MRGLTFHGDQDVRVEDVPDAHIEKPTDAVVKMTMAAICGSDLHILNAGTGNNLIIGGFGTDTISGGSTSNVILGDSGRVTASAIDGTLGKGAKR